jgi:hypothetical protein
MILLRAAIPGLDQDKRLHIIETFCWLPFWERCRPGGELMGKGRFASRKKLKICVAYLMPFATFPRS